jgi:dTDP-glucose 4,6-dehydratase
MKRLLLTGGAGFIGHHLVEHILRTTDWKITIVDRLTYSGDLNRLTDIECWEREKGRVNFVYHDLRAPLDPIYKHLFRIDYVIHAAAESHVDNSIRNPRLFAESNVLGTVNMLELCRQIQPEKFIYVSTDEVYGPVSADMKDLHKEGEPHRPSNPYSASKSSGEDFCRAYHDTYGAPVMITNTMNNFGQRQDPEKFVPKTIISIYREEPVTLHCRKSADGEEIFEVSSRCWLHARNHADGLLFLLNKGQSGEQYNITGTWAEVSTIAGMIANDMRHGPYKRNWEDFHSFRPGHDMHYGLDGTKMEKLGWVAPVDFRESLTDTVKWSMDHKKWLGL